MMTIRNINLTACLCALFALASSCASSPESGWAPASDNIHTRWASEVSPSNSHPEYPRPQMIRPEWRSLNGLWDYSVSKAEDSSMPEAEGQILVPFCIESSLSGVGRTITADDALWYRTEFKIPLKWRSSEKILLHFEAVDWSAEAWLNGEYLGSHTGAYTSFAFDIAPYLVPGRQELVVKVKDATDNDFQPRGKQVSNPNGIWYTAVSGIWQSVWMEPVGATSVESYAALSDIDNGTVTLDVKVNSPAEGDLVSVSMNCEGKTCSATVPCGQSIVLSPEEYRLWCPEDPCLYDLDIKVLRNGKAVDSVTGYTAMRKISVVTDASGHRRMALNNKILFHYGPLDQGWWPDGLYTAPTYEAMVYDLDKTLEYGFNMIRKHIKVEPATWYRACDERGILVWQDMPSFADNQKNHWSQGDDIYDAGTDWPATDAAKANFYKEWNEIMDQLMNYPCIVVWVPFNEAWGQFDTRQVAAFTCEKDPSRLVNHASGGNWVSDCSGDLLDSHYYPHPQMRITDPSKVNVLGEYGGIGLPIEGHLWQKDKNWGYVRFTDSKQVTDKYLEYSDMLRQLVCDGCSAAVYTQTTDVEGEVNGLMTYDRAIDKLETCRVREANRAIISLLK